MPISTIINGGTWSILLLQYVHTTQLFQKNVVSSYTLRAYSCSSDIYSSCKVQANRTISIWRGANGKYAGDTP